MDAKTLILLMYAGLGVLLVVLSIPLILNKIKPNLWYGFRVVKTINNPEIWYKANHYAGVRLAVAGAVSALGAVAAYFLMPNADLEVYSFVVLGISLTALAVATVMSFIYLRTL
jgi:uncharacterized membrane protein